MESVFPLPRDYLPEGTLLGSYEIKAVLGQGGFGVSYWAIDRQLGREVVLKEHYPAGLCKRAGEGAEVIPADSLWENSYRRSLNSFCREARSFPYGRRGGISNHSDQVEIIQSMGII